MNAPAPRIACRARSLATAVCLFAVPALCPGLTPFHEAMPESRPFDRVSTNYITPHIRWAKPLAGGTLKVAVLAPLMRHRETVELAQRLDLEFAALITSEPGEFTGDYFFLNEEETLALNLSKLAPGHRFDVMILAVDWHILPRPLKLEIARRVNAGMGLLCTGHEGFHPFMQNAGTLLEAEEFRDVEVAPGPVVPGAGLDDALDDAFDDGLDIELEEKAEAAGPDGPRMARRFIRISMSPDELLVGNVRVDETSFGKGRVVSVFGLRGNAIGSSDPPLAFKVPLEGKRRLRILYDCHMAHLAKAVVYAAGREARCGIEFLSRRGGTVSVALRAEEPAPDAAVDLVVMDELRRRKAHERRPVQLKPGRDTLEFTLPPLCEGGRHFVVARLMNGQKVAGWDVLSFEAGAANGVERYDFAPFYGRGRPVTGSVTLRRPLEPGHALVLELMDNLDRVLFRQTAERGQTIRFEAPAPDALVPLHRVRALIRAQDATIYDYDCEFLVGMAQPDNYNLVIWSDASQHYYRQVLMDRYYELGVTAGMGATTLAAANLRPWCYVTHVAQRRESETERKARLRHELREAVREAATPGDPLALVEGGEEPGMALPAIEEAGQDKADNPPGPAGNPCFNDPAWAAEETARLADAVRGLLPFSPVGYSLGDENQIGLTCHSAHCIRAWRRWLKEQYGDLAQVNERYETAFASWDKVVWPSFEEVGGSPGKLAAWYDRQRFTDWTFNNAHLVCRSAVLGAHADARVGFSSFFNPRPERGVDALRAFPWATFNNQYQDARWEDLMRAFGPREGHFAVIQGTYRGYKHRLEFVCYPWLEFFRGATGKMWWRGQYFKDAASALDPGYEPLPPFAGNLAMANEVRRGIFQLVRGSEFRNYGIRVLYSMADMYAAYAADPKNGPDTWLARAQGMIRGLRRAGWQFDYLSPEQLESGVPADARLLFLPGTECMSPAMADAVTEFVRSGGVLVADIVPGTRDMGLKPRPEPLLAGLFEGLKAGGDRAAGQGRAFLAGELLRTAKGYEAVPGRRLLTRIVEASGVDRGWSLLQPDGSAAEGWSLFTFGNGRSVLLAIGAQDARFDDPPAPYVLELNEPGAIYDVRSKALLGRGARAALELDPARPLLLAVLPEAVGELKVSSDGDGPYRAGDTIELRFELDPAPACLTACWVEIAGPDGSLLRHYAAPVPLRDGRATHAWRTALSDTGRHEVVVTETISGRQARLPVVLRAD